MKLKKIFVVMELNNTLMKLIEFKKICFKKKNYF